MHGDCNGLEPWSWGLTVPRCADLGAVVSAVGLVSTLRSVLRFVANVCPSIFTAAMRRRATWRLVILIFL
jgi:hypothetical protein